MIRKFMLTAAALSLLTIVSIQMPVLTQPVIINSAIDASSIGKALEAISTTPFYKRPLLVLESPGGSADQTELFNRLVSLEGLKYDSLVVGQASSAAANIFAGGITRKMTKSAKLMFHEIRIHITASVFGGAEAVTRTDLHSYVETGEFADNSKIKEKGAVKAVLKRIPKKLLRKISKELSKADDEMTAQVAKALNKTVEQVVTELIVPNVDTVLTAKKALKLGVATEIVE